MTITKSYINTLLKSSEEILPKLYKCDTCFRPQLTPAQVALLSKGEVVCKVCFKEAV